MKKLIYLSASAALLLSIITSCKQVPTTQTINGIVYDASMNNITVISNQGDTINISTMDTNPQKVPGVLLNDSVKVTCSTENIDGVQVLKAAELTVTAHSPYYYIQGEPRMRIRIGLVRVAPRWRARRYCCMVCR